MRRDTVVGVITGLAVLVVLDPSAGFAGSAEPQTVRMSFASATGAAPTTTALASNWNPATVGDPVRLSIQVASADGTPTGTVDVVDGVATICNNVALDADGFASCEVQLQPEVYPLTAVYSGDARSAPSTSVPLAQTVRAPRETPAGTIDTG